MTYPARPNVKARFRTRPGQLFTDRVMQLIALVADGKTDEEAGLELEITAPTIKVYLSRVYDALGIGLKFGGNPRVKLARWYVRYEQGERNYAAGDGGCD